MRNLGCLTKFFINSGGSLSIVSSIAKEHERTSKTSFRFLGGMYFLLFEFVFTEEVALRLSDLHNPILGTVDFWRNHLTSPVRSASS